MKRLVTSILVLLLLAFLGLDITSAQDETTKSLHQAIADGKIDQVKSLLSKGADISAKNRMGWSPLHTAVSNRRQEIAELLISKGADVNIRDGGGRAPLHLAVSIGQKELVELLIAKGADVNAMSGSENALSLAKKRQQKEIVEILLKHGAKEPDLEALMGDRNYGEGETYQDNQGQGIQPRSRGINMVQTPAEVDLLADPNEIKARIKTFSGLEKSLKEVGDKSNNETRQWEQKRYDNRTYLLKSVQQQFEDEIGFIRKIAVQEKAKKTTEAIDNVLSIRQERFKMVSKELMAQKREQQQTQSSSTRTRGRTSGRSTRGRYPQRGQPYGENTAGPLSDSGNSTPGTNRYERTAQPSEQVDRVTQDEIRQWLQTTVDNKAELAKAVNPQIQADIGSIRKIADEEKAKKTVAAIDGLLLARQMRFDEFAKKAEEEKRSQQQNQDPSNRSGYGDPSQRSTQQSGRYRGRTSRGGTAQGEATQQQNTYGTRGRRR